MARTPKKKRTFHQELVLNRWMLSHFHGDGLMTLKARLGDDRHEVIRTSLRVCCVEVEREDRRGLQR